MSEQPIAPASSGGNFLTRKFAGIPGWIILGGVALLAYWYFSHQSTAATTTGLKTTGGGGTSRTGNTTLKKGAVTINVKQSPGDDNDQPEPKPPHRHGTHGHIGPGGKPAAPGLHEYTANGKLSLNDVAKQHKTTAAKVAATTKQYKNNIGKELGKYLDSPSDYGKPIPQGTVIVYKDG